MSADKSGNSIRNILVGVDGSEKSIRALEWASELAATLGAQIDVVIAWQTPFPVIELVSLGFDLDLTEFNERPYEIAELRIEKAIKHVFGKVNPAGVTRSISEGYPGLVLVEKSSEADLLVLGNRGHSPVVETLLGSVSQHCLAHAQCPVVIIK
jgi:nucleotide-binding universal stress UspA family protein